MKTDLPPLKWLKTFEATARLLNFSAAARELNMTQSAVSQQIKLLEHYLGDQLFIRSHRKVSLSKCGLAYLLVVQNALSTLQRRTAEIFSTVAEGTLVIEVNYAFSCFWLSSQIGNFSARFPGISMQLMHANWESEYSLGNEDLAIVYDTASTTKQMGDPLLSPYVQPYTSASMAKLISAPEDLLSLPLIEISGASHSWIQWFEKVGIDATEHDINFHEVDTLLAAAIMVDSGLGLMLGFTDLFRKQTLAKKLVAPFDEKIETADNYFLIFPEAKPLSKSATVFRDWLLSGMEALKG